MYRAAGQVLVDDALALVNGRWITALVALGWDEISLFGCDPTERAVTCLVAVVRRQLIVAATKASVRYPDSHGLSRHHYRFGDAAEQVALIWELGAVPDDHEHVRTSAAIEKSSTRESP